MKKLFLMLAIALAASAALAALRAPKGSAAMRGAALARDYGCVGCHEPTGAAVTANPGSLRGVIPSFRSGPAVSGFWVRDYPDFRAWVTQGATEQSRQEQQRLQPGSRAATIRMPVYGASLGEAQLRDLYAYYRTANAFALPSGEAAARGLQVAREQGCFACHGSYGLTGLPNPGSFKGYIPPWQGEDFRELARNDDEIREWIRTGALARLQANPLARFFIERQKIHMPAYAAKLSDADIGDLVGYVRAVSGDVADAAAPATAAAPAAAPVAAPVDDVSPAHSAIDGAALFRESGCVTCHRPTGEEGFTDVQGIELPARAKLAARLQVAARMLQAREAEARWAPADLCHYYRLVAGEYRDMAELIRVGRNAADDPGPYRDDAHRTAMPPWALRANAQATAGLPVEVASGAILDALLIENNPALGPERIRNWLAQAERCAEPPPVAAPTDDPARREALRQRTEVLDRAGQLFDAVPQTAFFSHEVHLLDKVGYRVDGDVDFWLLRQSAKIGDVAAVLARGEFPNPAKFVIAVDKSRPVYRTYFYTTREGVKHGDPGHYDDAPLSDCYGCHVSGPRAVRPIEEDGIPALDAQAWNHIREMNVSMQSYGDMVTTWPADQTALAPAWQEPVTIGVCQSCHAVGAIRAPVRRYHTHTLEVLIDAAVRDDGFSVKRSDGRLAVMPVVAPLTEESRLDLLDWTNLNEHKRKRPRNQPSASPPPSH